MESTIQHEIALACAALLRKNAVNPDNTRERNGRGEPKTNAEAVAWLLKAGSDPDITLENVEDALWRIYKRNKPASQTRRWVTQLLFDLGQQEGITARDALLVASNLYLLSPQGSPERQEGIRRLLVLAHRRDIPFEDTVEAAHSLYRISSKKSPERQLAVEALLTQARWPDTTIAQAQEAASALCNVSLLWSQERIRSVEALIELTRRPDLSFEDAVVLDDSRISHAGTKALVQQQWAAKKQMWETIAQRTDLTEEQSVQAIKAIKDYRYFLEYHKKSQKKV